MQSARALGAVLILLLSGNIALTQQLRLGKNPYTVEKSAVLELQSDNQGLLFTRIADTSLINVLSPSNGMVVFFTPTSQLLLRAGGYWQALTPTSALLNYWSVSGNSNGVIKKIGNVDNYDLPFITNNTERLRITNTGSVGIGTSSPSTVLHVKTGVTDDSGIRLENLTSSSATTSNAAVVGVDATGKIVRTKTPVYYTNGAGGTATTEQITKIWVAEVTNTATGIQTVNFPTNFTFTNVLSIQLTAKGGTGLADAPIAMITSNTTSSVTIRVLESKNTGVLVGGNIEGLEPHTSTSTKIYIRVEGN